MFAWRSALRLRSSIKRGELPEREFGIAVLFCLDSAATKMSDESQRPLSLRRSRRSIGLQQTNDARNETDLDGTASTATTPGRKTKSRKRVRFSDPGPLTNLDDELSTGLTPMIRRTSLIPKNSRRHSTPARLSRLGSLEDDHEGSMSSSSEVHFLPLRQVLDGRVKRRIRRNGLSEEMNVIYAERRRRAQETREEIERLKKELEEKDEEIRRLHDETIDVDTERVWDLEQKIEALKNELAARSGARQQIIPSSPSCNWMTAARDPFSDDFMDLDTVDADDDDMFGQTTMADLASSTPSRRVRASFPTPPTTSPARAPLSPCSSHFRPPSTPCSHAGVQASLPDPEKQEMEDELASLQLEVCKLTMKLESYTALASRLSDKLSPYTPLTPTDASSSSLLSPHSEIDGRLATVLQTLSDRTAVLLDLNKSLSGLGFPGSDASEIVTSLSSAFRAARLELEYLAPGEVTLPLTSAGAAVLDLVLDRLRDLAKRNREADDSIDEYHSIELSLRQQLSARVDAMGILNKDVNRMESEVRQRDERIAELEVGLERLKGAVQRYTRDVSELESLVQRMETELEASNAGRVQEELAHEEASKQLSESLEQKTATITDLEAKLLAAVEQTSSLQAQLAAMQTAHAKAIDDLRSSHKSEAARLNKAQGQALALRDARVAELRLEIDRVNESLRTAHETIRQLRVENGRLTELNETLTADNVELGSKREVDKRKAKEVIDSMKAELERVVRMSEGFLAGTPKKPRRSLGLGDVRRDSGLGDGEDDASTATSEAEGKSNSGGLLSGDLAKRGRGKKRRRYDSGLGFLDEEEVV
ncbi:myosin heavy chain, skeletal muscle, adult [Podospora aff. communis PSN243]|uniref:Myosin heavy chain, skeletal muscle, adult n=1 Tax=Podospora aff. communis PSN243 TaxID=3040156 RepID=A0AAV9GCF9_9PEZI|nr:myosin heavy chain, skeletal muscle, adult [Podospora aff. communis PSN243]